MTTPHAEVGGSTCERLLLCPGSLTLGRRAPVRKGSAFADEGTRLHEVMARGIEQGGGHGDEPLVASALAYLAPILHSAKLVLVEEQVTFGGIPNSFGTLDLAVVDAAGELHVVDHKFGYVEVQPTTPQLKFYASAARRHQRLAPFIRPGSSVHLHIVQPQSDPVGKRITVRLLDLFAFERSLIEAYRLANGPLPPLNTGTQCRWCPAKTICPKLAEEAKGFEFHKDLPPERLAEMLELAERLEHVAAAYRVEAHNSMTEGLRVPGFKLVMKRAIRKWSDPAALLKAFPAATAPVEALSPAQFEKKFDISTVKHLIVAESSGTVVTESSDPRPEVIPAQRFTKLANSLKAKQL